MMNEFVWKRQETIAEVGNMKEEVKKVLVIYTGGTIGMKMTSEYGKLRGSGSSRRVCKFIRREGNELM